MSRGTRVFFDEQGNRQTKELPDFTDEEQAEIAAWLQAQQDAQDAADQRDAVVALILEQQPDAVAAKVQAIQSARNQTLPPGGGGAAPPVRLPPGGSS